MKAWAAGAAILGLAACIENPGVDQGLATKHDRLSATALLADKYPLRVRLERKADGTFLYLGNPGAVRIDSLAYFIQFPWIAGNSRQDIPGIYPVFTEWPGLEISGTHPELRPGEETELGRLEGGGPREMDKYHIRFIPISGKMAGVLEGSRYAGYYRGRFSLDSRTGERDSGAIRGVVAGNGFYFWLLSRDKGRSTLWGRVDQDTILSAHFQGELWWPPGAMAMERYGAAFGMRPAPASDSVDLDFELRERDSPSRPEFTLDMGIRMLRIPGPRWIVSKPSGPRPIDEPYRN